MRVRRLVVTSLVATASMACNLTLHDVREEEREMTVDGGRADAANGADAADAGHFCDALPAHDFCADFDEGSLRMGWETVPLSGGTVVSELTYGDFVSAPASARFGVTQIDSTDFSSVNAGVSSPPDSPTEITLAFDMKVEALGAMRDFNFVYLGLGDATPDFFLNIASGDGTTTGITMIEEGGNENAPNGSLDDSPDVGEWAHFGLQVTIPDGGGLPHLTATLTKLDADGGNGVETVYDKDLGTPWSAGRATFRVGVAYITDPTPQTTVLVDNVTLDAK